MKHVYFFAARKGLIKIGYSANVRTRLVNQRQSYSDFELLGVVEGDVSVERAYHQRFAERRYKGEWFYDTPELRAEIKNIVGANPMPKMPNTEPGGRYKVDWDFSKTPYAVAQREEEARAAERRAPLNDLLDWAEEEMRGMVSLAPVCEEDIVQQTRLLKYQHLLVAIISGREDRQINSDEESDLSKQRDQFRLFVENIITCDAEQQRRTAVA